VALSGTAGQTDAYSRSAARWAAGPDRVYRPLGVALVDALAGCLPRPLAGRRALDLGAGTGPVSAALAARGARVVAVDRAVGMLALDRHGRPPAVVADADALPVRPRSCAAAAAGCLLAHVADPGTALAAVAAAVEPGGVVAASAFPTAWRDPLKAAVEAVLVAHGWRPPGWYEAMKGSAATGAAAPFRALAEDVGLAAEVAELSVPVELPSAGAVVEWRLGMAHAAPWFDGLRADRRDAVQADAVEAVRTSAGAGPVRLDVPLLVLLARVP
jgi:trans-aconitate methyltransferase